MMATARVQYTRSGAQADRNELFNKGTLSTRR